jgi:hypothetical protein
MTYSRDYSELDLVRVREGAGPCRAAFQSVCAQDSRKAAALLNDRRLTFPCLYTLSPEIEPGLYPYLSRRNALGLRLIHRAQDTAGTQQTDSLSHTGKDEHAALKWILETGRAEDGMEDAYDEILDIAASVLLNAYRDASVLPLVSDMIFARHREGRNIHDLTWAFFNIRHPGALRLIAEGLCSGDAQDVSLACDLLGIESHGGESDPRRRYEDYMQWLNDNDPYLYFTGESMQYASAPAYCRVDLDRKFLQRGTASYQKKPLVPATREEEARLRAFRAMGDEDKKLLAEYSQRMHSRDARAWKRWMRHPVGEQLRAARMAEEGSR